MAARKLKEERSTPALVRENLKVTMVLVVWPFSFFSSKLMVDHGYFTNGIGLI